MMMRVVMLSMLLCAAGAAHAEPKTATDKIVDRFMELDADETAGISEEEYLLMVTGRARERFIEMDRNADGEVSEDEYRDFWLQRKSAHYRLER